jgi:hypothetical protein
MKLRLEPVSVSTVRYLDGEGGPRVVEWNGDDTFTPVCISCDWKGKPRIKHSEALAAVGSHRKSARHLANIAT